jgi:hypothetical protein
MLEPRDLEILRALLRLRYLSTRQINAAFFVNQRISRRRLQKLSEAGYIRLHRKGLPKTALTGAWRLMNRGLQAVGDAFREEWIPDHLVDRVAEGSLLRLHERDATSQIYLDLVVPDPPLFPEGRKVMQCRLWAKEIRSHAGAITWRPKHDVVLEYEFRGKHRQLIPDVTITCPARKARVFLVLDRPAKRRAWAGKVFERYNEFIGIRGPVDRGFSDGHTPCFLFVAYSWDRAEAIRAILDNVRLKQMRPYVVLYKQAARWLEGTLLDGEQPLYLEEGGMIGRGDGEDAS